MIDQEKEYCEMGVLYQLCGSRCLTDCPFNKGIKVGSNGCKSCPDYRGKRAHFPYGMAILFVLCEKQRLANAMKKPPEL